MFNMNYFKNRARLFIVVTILISCHVTKKIEKQMLPVFDIEGHRGCRGLMPENTIPAMVKAIDIGVTTLEMDAVITNDKQVILSHEPFFNHEISTLMPGTYAQSEISIANERSWNIYKMNYEEVKKIDVGSRIHPRFPQQEKLFVFKPRLIDVIDSVENYCLQKKIPPVFYNIETKTNPATDGIFHPAPEEFIDLLMKLILKKGIQDRVIIQSFDYRTLKILHRQYPEMKTAALVEDHDKKSLEEHIRELGFVPTIYSPHYSLVNESLLSDCHGKHIKLIPWTVNDVTTIEKLRTMGVDGIISDYPNLFH